ncbi:uncharacterized protein FIBRA_09578 [Fibroporia radiculosa]|uniref:Reverse transcriptase domain-containing protein n=1 Tax=Fibroporia radiculosa TaxID=599839 RepID=J7SD69_9APHY|nr:uncharacterized protein FIBRA_09578 [Fibroporia radiculosa]CCM07233.1 predicted protein [Fibroporia radiculosa]
MFTKLDLHAGYNNICIKEGDEWKGAFITPQGLFKPTVMFFGMTNSPATFQAMMDGMAENKVSAVLNWPKIDSIKALQQFLGFANFYRQFIPGYSKVAQPLFDLLVKGIKWRWTDDHDKAINQLKECFKTQPLFVQPDVKPFRMPP